LSAPIFNEKFRRPSIGFTEILKKGAGGFYRERDQYVPVMFRALVIAYDTKGGMLETPDGTPEGGTPYEQHVVVPGTSGGAPRDLGSYTVTPTLGPRNPKGSVRARILSNNIDQFTDDDSLRTYWPLFPGLHNPDAGELVYVMFEDEEMLHGLWVAPVPTSDPNENPNQVLISQLLQDVISGNQTLFGLVNAPADNSTANIPVKQPHRLTNLFVNTGKT